MVFPRRSVPAARCIPTIVVLSLWGWIAQAQAPVDSIAPHRLSFAFGADTLKVPYERNHPLGESHPGFDRAVVMIHGTGRTAPSYYHTLLLSAQDADHAETHTLLLAPQFLAEVDLDSTDIPTDDLLFWENSGWDNCWKSGDPSCSTATYPRAHRLSSFAVVDSILFRLASRNEDMATIIVAGHSAGGQFTNRYAASNRMEQQIREDYGVEVKYVVANPSSYVYFNGERRLAGTLDEFGPFDSSICWYYNHYRYGMENLNPYLSAVTADSVRAQYARRTVTLLLGELDNDPASDALDMSCPAMAQGNHRLERGRIYHNYLRHYFGSELTGTHEQAIVAGAEHSARQMYVSGCGMYFLFDYGSCSLSPLTLQPPPFPLSLQAAVSTVPGGTTILLAPGVYAGPGYRDIQFSGKAISVRSATGDPTTCIIDCQNAGRGFRFASDETAESIVKDLTIRNGWTSGNGGGISCTDADPTINNCILVDNDASGVGGGLSCILFSNPWVTKCTFHSNGAPQGGGIYCSSWSDIRLEQTIIDSNTTGEAFACDASSIPEYIRNNDFFANAGGDWTGQIAGSLGVSGNIQSDPLFCNAPTTFYLCADSPCLPAGMGAMPQGCAACGPYVCCFEDGSCVLYHEESECTGAGGTWNPGMGSVCLPNPCPAAEGACCFWGVCQIETEENCAYAGGTYVGDLTTCSPNPCPAACCVDESCTYVVEDSCSGTWYSGTTCFGNPCQLHACCVDEVCSLTTEMDCGGTYYPMVDSCDPDPCIEPPTSVCCASGQCFIVTEEFCVNNYGGTWYEDWVSCTPNPCTLAPCCVEESCSFTIESECGGTWHADLVDCVPNPCIEAACCVETSCLIKIESDCDDLGGTWHADWNTCDPNPCILAACCVGGACTVTHLSDCEGTWFPNELTCDPNPCPAGCCTEGTCSIATEEDCTNGNGIWHADWDACDDPDPCPAVCCDNGACTIVAEHACSGEWHAEGTSCDPNPCFFIVKPDGTGDYATVQAAINAASDEDMIALTNGTFQVATHQGAEPSGINFKGKAITVRSLSGNPAHCIIDGGSTYRGFTFNNAEGFGSVLEGIRITNGFAVFGGAIWCLGASPTIHNCEMVQNASGSNGGALLCQSSSPSVSDCIFIENTVPGDGGAICGANGSMINLSGCVFVGNVAGQNGGAVCSGASSASAEARNCTFYGNGAVQGGSIYSYTGSTPSWWEDTIVAFGVQGAAVEAQTAGAAPSLRCCDLFGNAGGDWVGFIAGQLGLWGNINQDPLFCDAPGNLSLCWNSPCTAENSPCGRQIGVFGAGCGICGPEDIRACCVGGACSLVTEVGCEALGGTWHVEQEACDPNPCPAVCCTGGDCAVSTENVCAYLDGVWYEAWTSCDPNPCPAVCCLGEGCALTTEEGCADQEGIWYADWTTCTPNPCSALPLWADHDVGEIVLTLTAEGTIGFLTGDEWEGSGLRYPREGENLLWVGGLWVGESETYVANRDYEADPNREWRVSSSPDGHIVIDENGISHQDIHASYSDSAATQPRGLFVEQESWAYAVNSAATDLVIVHYRVLNLGNFPLSDLYAGIFMDLDIPDASRNTGGVDADLDLTYMTGHPDSAAVYAGVQVLQGQGEPPVSNLTLINNPSYVWPNAYILDADKYAFLSALDSAHVVTDPDTITDFGLLSAAGPFDLDAGSEQRITFAILGGVDLDDLRQSARVARIIHSGGFLDVPEDSDLPIRVACLRSVLPNPFREEARIRFDLPETQPVSLNVYDVNGSLIRRLAHGPQAAGPHILVWDRRNEIGRVAPGGVYFIHLTVGRSRESRRVILLR